jgi:hypothetical protein
MKLKSTHAILGAALFALPAVTQAQPSAHYPPGVEGIKGASLPPPGIYLRDYNVAYFARTKNDAKGNEIPGLNPDVFIYAKQVTSDSGSNNPRDRVAAAGPEITAFCSKLGVNTSLRYLYEFMSENRFQGHTVALTFTKRF